MSPWAINRLSKAVERGALIAYPSDTIWGLGCHPLNATSVNRLLQLKHRSASKGLILLAPELDYCKPYIDSSLSSAELRRLGQIPDDPVTWLVPASKRCPDWLRGQFPTIAIRLTQQDFLRRLCDPMRAPLVSTSANRSGEAPVRSALQAHRQFAHELDYIVTGFNPGTNQSSEIKFLVSGQTVRARGQ